MFYSNDEKHRKIAHFHDGERKERRNGTTRFRCVTIPCLLLLLLRFFKPVVLPFHFGCSDSIHFVSFPCPFLFREEDDVDAETRSARLRCGLRSDNQRGSGAWKRRRGLWTVHWVVEVDVRCQGHASACGADRGYGR